MLWRPSSGEATRQNSRAGNELQSYSARRNAPAKTPPDIPVPACAVVLHVHPAAAGDTRLQQYQSPVRINGQCGRFFLKGGAAAFSPRMRTATCIRPAGSGGVNLRDWGVRRLAHKTSHLSIYSVGKKVERQGKRRMQKATLHRQHDHMRRMNLMFLRESKPLGGSLPMGSSPLGRVLNTSVAGHGRALSKKDCGS